MNRPSEDNVIYANFGAKTRVASAEETGAADLSAVQASMSPAAMRVLNAAVRQTDAARVKRGHQYAAGGHVFDLRVRFERFEASVAGSQNEPFHTALWLPTRSRLEVMGALREMAHSAGAVERAASGAFPDEVLDVLLAKSARECTFDCTCPDSSAVCKHAVALAETAARRIDEEPATVLTVRNLSLRTLEESVRTGARSQVEENAREGSVYFWSGRELPDLPRPKVAPMIDDSDTDLLRHAMETVSFTNIDLLNAVADIEDLYDIMTEEESGRRP